MLSTLSSRVTAGGAVGFFVLGLLVASYGPLLPQVREQFGLSAVAGGLLLSAHFAGSVAGVLLAGAASRRTTARARLRTAGLVLAAGATAAAFAPSWPMLLVAVLVTGLGWGGLELDVNVLLSRSHGERSGAVLNAVSAAFGAGAVAAPLLVAAGAGRTALLLLGAGVALGTLPLLASTPDAPAQQMTPQVEGRSAVTVQLGFVVLLLLYVGAEVGAAGWAPTHLVETAADQTGGAGVAAASTAAFWTCFTLGRVLGATVSLRMRPAVLLPGTLLLACASLLVAVRAEAAPFAYAAVGLFFAPVWPTTMAWLAASTRTGAGTTSLVIAGASTGPVLVSPAIGAAHDAAGPVAIPYVLLAVTGLTAALAVALGRSTRRTSPAVARPVSPAGEPGR